MKKREISSKIGLWAVILVMATQVAHAGFFDSISTFMKERSEIYSHSKNIGNGIRELYRERKSISSLAVASSQLIQAYKEIKNKKANISSIVNIAQQINTLVSAYKNVAPKASSVYNRIEPDVNYFSKLKDSSDDQSLAIGNKLFKIESLSESRISKLAGSGGWARVFDAVKDNPLNIFRWGKLSDEYQYGKAEAKYALKCTQIAFEARSYYKAATDSISQLLDIKSQIDGILSGNLESILNLPKSIESIQGASGGVEDFGGLMQSAADRFGKRFDELKVAQDEYVAAHQKYTRGKATPAQAVTVGTAPSSNSYSGVKGISTTSSTKPATTSTVSLKSAMEAYQKAYQRYTNTLQNSGTSEQERAQAAEALNVARTQYEAAKAAAGK